MQCPNASTTPADSPYPVHHLRSLFEPYVWDWFTDTFGQPSPPQVASWPKIAGGKDTLIFSPTGSGKTLAAFLWCINELFRMGSQQVLGNSVRVLNISPLKALNNDIQKNLFDPLHGIRSYAQQAGVDVPDVRSEVRTGDTTMRQRARMARRPPHILITTPESLFIILATPKFREAFRNVRYVIVDEIHAISDNKRGVHLSLSLERLQHLAGESQRLVRIRLSATQKPLDQIAGFLVGRGHDGLPLQCEIIDCGARKNLNVSVISPVDNLLEAHLDSVWASIYDQLNSLIAEHETTLICTNSRYKAERTSIRLNELSFARPIAVGAHHGSMSKRVRLDMEDRLKRAALDALVATSSLELGIDVGSIDFVCQKQSPKSVSTGLQRIERAGHLLDATSKGRLLVIDRDDLVESAVLVRAVLEGRIEPTSVPMNCLDVLAQQIVGAVAADDWPADDLFDLCRGSYCYGSLKREDCDRVLDMLSGNYAFEMDYPPFPKILWDKVNDALYPERNARMIAFRASGTIPHVEDYDVFFEERKTRVGQLSEGFVEKLRVGDIFVLGSSSWRVRGVRRNRVVVENVYGEARTIPFWSGDRDSRTHDLGVLVGRFRAQMESVIGQGSDGADTIDWLQREYHVDKNGAQAIYEYFREQRLTTGRLPTDRLILVEHFRDELGRQQIVIHSSYGIRVHDPWAMAIAQAVEERYGIKPQTANVDDGILVTLPQEAGASWSDAQMAALPCLVTPDNLDQLLASAGLESPVFQSRFPHNAVRSLMVLRASSLFAACRDDEDFPLIKETLRECVTETLDAPHLRQVLVGLHTGAIQVAVLETKVPSPFTIPCCYWVSMGSSGPFRRESVEVGSCTCTESCRGRFSTRRHCAIYSMSRSSQTWSPGCSIPTPDAGHGMRMNWHAFSWSWATLSMSLTTRSRYWIEWKATGIRCWKSCCWPIERSRCLIPSAESRRDRWILTESFPLFRAAFGVKVELDAVDAELVHCLAERGPLSLSQSPISGLLEDRLQKLVNGYNVLRLPLGADDARVHRAQYVSVETWIPDSILVQTVSGDQALVMLVQQFLRCQGPTTKHDIMERYGLPDQVVQCVLDALLDQGNVVSGQYVPTKSFPQWCHRGNLQEIHRLTLNRLRREMEPATPEEYADSLIRWQHLHPDTRLMGIGGLRQVIGQI